MYFRQAAKNTHLVFDNENLISATGVEPAMRLADAAGLADLTAAHVRLAGPQAASTPLTMRSRYGGCGRIFKAVQEGDWPLARNVQKLTAPRGALSYPRCSREELEGRFLGLMAYLDPKR